MTCVKMVKFYWTLFQFFADVLQCEYDINTTVYRIHQTLTPEAPSSGHGTQQRKLLGKFVRDPPSLLKCIQVWYMVAILHTIVGNLERQFDARNTTLPCHEILLLVYVTSSVAWYAQTTKTKQQRGAGRLQKILNFAEFTAGK